MCAASGGRRAGGAGANGNGGREADDEELVRDLEGESWRDEKLQNNCLVHTQITCAHFFFHLNSCMLIGYINIANNSLVIQQAKLGTCQSISNGFL